MHSIPVQIRQRIAVLGRRSLPLGEHRAAAFARDLAHTVSLALMQHGDLDRVFHIYEGRLYAQLHDADMPASAARREMPDGRPAMRRVDEVLPRFDTSELYDRR